MNRPANESKGYSPADVEREVAEVWVREKCFHAEPTDPGKPYSIVIPPPNVTAALHLGHALNNTLQDILIRRHRMGGDNTVWLPGTDHAGIATQTVVEKRVLKEEGKKRTEFPREVFVAKIQAWKDEYEQTITSQLKAMGCSCDWDRQAFTMDEIRAKAVREAFFQLFKDGLIYRGKRLVNWDPVTQTALADDEVENEEIDGFFYYLKYPLEDGSSHVTVATTRPETMLGDTAVAINPKDPRAVSLCGKKIRLPIVGRIIPIVEDDYVVMADANSDDAKAKFATGFLKVTPAHDPNDYEIGQRHKLDVINIMAPDASISDKHGWTDVGEAGFLLGLSRETAREEVLEWFRRHGLLEDVKPYRHSVGHSYRSHVPIEPYLSDQWYCRVTDPRLAGAALAAMSPEQSESPQSLPDGRGSQGAIDPQTIAPNTSRDRKGASSSSLTAPLAYFITFACYGSWLHGDERGSIDREANLPGTPFLPADAERADEAAEKMVQPPFVMDEPMRRAVQAAIIEVCTHRGWPLQALHIRTRHVHVVLVSSESPEKIMNDFKAYATRRLRKENLIEADRRVWARHGSTRYLKDDGSVEAAVGYVVDEQGFPMEPAPVDRRTQTLPNGRGSHGGAIDPPTSATNTLATDTLATDTSRDRKGASSPPSSLTFYPARYAKTFQTWHENIRDWCISRQLWWGHRIPVWTYTFSQEGMKALEAKESPLKWSDCDQAAHEAVCAWQMFKADEVATPLHLRPKQGLIKGKPAAMFPSPKDGILSACFRESSELIKEAESLGFVQDPDVLDTWFSSGLWPLSTLGWPSDTPELAKWNPTSVLCTAREIITLWVSRMVMFNLYFKKQLPFTDVFIHAMIQDGEGRKMSKSLGNGVDPLDIIHSHGTDAMRFTLAAMATHTQDVRLPVKKDPATGRNTSEKFDEGRKFCNKIWQVTEGFALPNLAKTSCVPVHSDQWSLADRWIVSRFNQTLKECDESIADYRFDQYAKLAYEFFWNDFCAWYIEIAKLALRDPARAGQTANVVAAVLDGSLRLLHPIIPFITEALWWKLNSVRMDRSLPGKIEGTIKPRLVVSAWPTPGPVDESAEKIFPLLRDVIVAIRNLRNEHKVETKKNVPVSIAASSESSRWIKDNQQVIESLATCTVGSVGPDVKPPTNCGRAAAGGVEIFVEGLVDEAAELQRITKRIVEIERILPGMKARIENPSYRAKAPPKLVQQTEEQITAMGAELEKLKEDFKRFQP